MLKRSLALLGEAFGFCHFDRREKSFSLFFPAIFCGAQMKKDFSLRSK